MYSTYTYILSPSRRPRGDGTDCWQGRTYVPERRWAYPVETYSISCRLWSRGPPVRPCLPAVNKLRMEQGQQLGDAKKVGIILIDHAIRAQNDSKMNHRILQRYSSTNLQSTLPAGEKLDWTHLNFRIRWILKYRNFTVTSCQHPSTHFNFSFQLHFNYNNRCFANRKKSRQAITS